MGRKLWGLCPLGEGELGPYLTQYGHDRGLPASQVSSWSVQPFGHSAPMSQTDRTDRQDNCPIAEGEPFYKRPPKNYGRHGRRNRSGRPGGCRTNNLTNKYFCLHYKLINFRERGMNHSFSLVIVVFCIFGLFNLDRSIFQCIWINGDDDFHFISVWPWGTDKRFTKWNRPLKCCRPICQIIAMYCSIIVSNN